MTSSAALLRRLEDLEARVATLQLARRGDPAAAADAIERVKAQAASCLSARYKWVAPGYYDLSFEERARILGCRVSQLTKTLLFRGSVSGTENGGSSNGGDSEPVHMVVVVQYQAKINLKLLSEVGNALFNVQKRLSFALAPDEEGLAMTGFPHNGVSPFGSLKALPTVVAAAIAELPESFIWMGGGHVDLKIGVSVQELVDTLRARVADVSDPRDEDEC